VVAGRCTGLQIPPKQRIFCALYCLLFQRVTFGLGSNRVRSPWITRPKMPRSMQANAPAVCQYAHTLDFRKGVEMGPATREPAPVFPMTARTALLYLLRTHDGAADSDPRGVLGARSRDTCAPTPTTPR
jgi:hypothetical protein